VSAAAGVVDGDGGRGPRGRLVCGEGGIDDAHGEDARGTRSGYLWRRKDGSGGFPPLDETLPTSRGCHRARGAARGGGDRASCSLSRSPDTVRLVATSPRLAPGISSHPHDPEPTRSDLRQIERSIPEGGPGCRWHGRRHSGAPRRLPGTWTPPCTGAGYESTSISIGYVIPCAALRAPRSTRCAAAATEPERRAALPGAWMRAVGIREDPSSCVEACFSPRMRGMFRGSRCDRCCRSLRSR